MLSNGSSPQAIARILDIKPEMLQGSLQGIKGWTVIVTNDEHNIK